MSGIKGMKKYPQGIREKVVSEYNLGCSQNELSKKYCTKLQSYDEARLLIDEYIYFYNNQRIKLKTKLTPLEKRSQYVA